MKTSLENFVHGYLGLKGLSIIMMGLQLFLPHLASLADIVQSKLTTSYPV